jgi:hypothetical protein
MDQVVVDENLQLRGLCFDMGCTRFRIHPERKTQQRKGNLGGKLAEIMAMD